MGGSGVSGTANRNGDRLYELRNAGAAVTKISAIGDAVVRPCDTNERRSSRGVQSFAFQTELIVRICLLGLGEHCPELSAHVVRVEFRPDTGCEDPSQCSRQAVVASLDRLIARPRWLGAPWRTQVFESRSETASVWCAEATVGSWWRHLPSRARWDPYPRRRSRHAGDLRRAVHAVGR